MNMRAIHSTLRHHAGANMVPAMNSARSIAPRIRYSGNFAARPLMHLQHRRHNSSYLATFKKILEADKESGMFMSLRTYLLLSGSLGLGTLAYKAFIDDNSVDSSVYFYLSRYLITTKVLEQYLGKPARVRGLKQEEKMDGSQQSYIEVEGPLGIGRLYYDFAVLPEMSQVAFNVESLRFVRDSVDAVDLTRELKNWEEMMNSGKVDPSTSSDGEESFAGKVGFSLGIGAIIGFTLSALLIRIMKGRGSDVYNVALRRMDDHPIAKKLLGAPIKTNSKDYTGKIAEHMANFTVGCRGPQGTGKLFVVANKVKEEWKFSTLKIQVDESKKKYDLLKK